VIEIIAGTPVGGGQDRTARSVASVLGLEVTISNVPGRGGGNGWEQLIKRRGDHMVLGVSSPTLVTNALVGVSEIDHRDLTSIAMLYTEYSVVVTARGSPWAGPEAFLTGLARREITVSFATALGNMNHLALAEIARHVDVEAQHLPVRVFESARDALADVLNGDADAAMVSAASAVPELSNGTTVAVAVTSAHRLGGIFRQVPTWVEVGVKCDSGTWRGLVGPPALFPETIELWSTRLATATASPKWAGLLTENQWTSTYLGPTGTDRFLEAERQHLASLLYETGLLKVVGDV